MDASGHGEQLLHVYAGPAGPAAIIAGAGLKNCPLQGSILEYVQKDL